MIGPHRSPPQRPCAGKRAGAIIIPVLSRVLSCKGLAALVTGALMLGVSQLGRLSLAQAYRPYHEMQYEEAVAAARTTAPSADVLVLGNSRTWLGVSAWVLGRDLRLPWTGGSIPKIAKLTPSGGTPAVALWLWRRIVSSGPQPRPKLLVLGVAPIDFSDNSPGRDYALRYLFGIRDVPWLLEFGRAQDAAAVLTYRAFPLYAHRATFLSMLRHAHRALFVSPPRGRHRLATAGVAPAGWWVAQYYIWYQGYRVEPFQAHALDELVADAQRRGVRVVLVSLPVAPQLLKVDAGGPPPPDLLRRTGGRRSADRSKSALALFRKMIRARVKRYRVSYFDYMTPEQSVRFQYLDGSHLTLESASAFTRELAQRINRELAPAASEGAASK